MKKILGNLTVQVILGIVLGVIAGLYIPSIAGPARMISDTFLNMIRMVIAPIIFLSIVLGIASMGDMKKVGRIGGKALLYFEIVTTIAILLGMLSANIFGPGRGVVIADVDVTKVEQFKQQGSDFNWVDFFIHIVPSNIFDSFTRGDILQILFFAILFGYGLTKLGSAGATVLNSFDKLQHVFFNIMKFVMKLAPVGAFGGMAFTIGKYGVHALLPLGKLMICLYGTLLFFIFIVLFSICRMYRFSLWQYLKYIKEEIFIVLGTASSEPVLSNMMNKMERAGCSKSVVGLVVPTGYSFNLDGTSISLAMTVIFLAQVFNIPLSIGQQITIVGVLVVTSKGAAAVVGSAMIVMASTLSILKIIPVESLAILIGVDRFMATGRSVTNLIGNGIATIIIAKSEKEFDIEKYQAAISGKYPPVPEPAIVVEEKLHPLREAASF